MHQFRAQRPLFPKPTLYVLLFFLLLCSFFRSSAECTRHLRRWTVVSRDQPSLLPVLFLALSLTRALPAVYTGPTTITWHSYQPAVPLPPPAFPFAEEQPWHCIILLTFPPFQWSSLWYSGLPLLSPSLFSLARVGRQFGCFTSLFSFHCLYLFIYISCLLTY